MLKQDDLGDKIFLSNFNPLVCPWNCSKLLHTSLNQSIGKDVNGAK